MSQTLKITLLKTSVFCGNSTFLGGSERKSPENKATMVQEGQSLFLPWKQFKGVIQVATNFAVYLGGGGGVYGKTSKHNNFLTSRPIQTNDGSFDEEFSLVSGKTYPVYPRSHFGPEPTSNSSCISEKGSNLDLNSRNLYYPFKFYQKHCLTQTSNSLQQLFAKAGVWDSNREYSAQGGLEFRCRHRPSVSGPFLWLGRLVPLILPSPGSIVYFISPNKLNFANFETFLSKYL